MASPQRAAHAVTPELVVVRRPDREQRVACELHDLAAMLADQLDQLAEAVVQQLGELLDTARPGSSQPLGKRREPGDVGEQDRRQELLALRLAQWLMPIGKTPDDERGNIAGELDRVAVSLMLSSSNRLLHVVPPSREHLVLVAARRRSGSWSGSLLNAICGKWLTQRCCTPCRRPCRQSSRAIWVVQMVEQWVGRAAVARPSAGPVPAGAPAGWCRKDRGQLAGDLGPVGRRHGRLGGDTAAREQVEAGGLETRRLALDPLVASHLRLVGADLGGPPECRRPAVSRRTSTPVPARSWFRGITDRPSLTVTLPTIQPAGRERRQGTRDADGTDWASSHCGSRSVQARLPTLVGVAAASW